jgi:hypothetical protein
MFSYKMTDTQRAKFKADILRDYPKLNQCPEVVDNLLDAYFQDPEKFKENVKKEQLKEKKDAKKKKVETIEKPKVVVIENGIEKVNADDVVVGKRTIPKDGDLEKNESGRINISAVRDVQVGATKDEVCETVEIV